MCGLNSEPEIQAAKSPIKNLTGIVKGDIVQNSNINNQGNQIS